MSTTLITCFNRIFRKARHSRLDPASLVRHLGKRQAHLHPGQRAHQRQVVEVADVSDAKHLVGDLAQSAAERHVEVIQHHFAKRDFAVAGVEMGLKLAKVPHKKGGVEAAMASLTENTVKANK